MGMLQWPAGLAVIKGLLVQGGNLMVQPEVFSVTTLTGRRRRRQTVVPLPLVDATGNILMTTQAILAHVAPE